MSFSCYDMIHKDFEAVCSFDADKKKNEFVL